MIFDARYVSALSNVLPRPAWADFIETELAPLTIAVARLPAAPAVATHGGLRALLAERSERPWLVVGDPGSGKSTLLGDLARELLKDRAWVFFLPMASFDVDRAIERQLRGSMFSDKQIRELLRSGGATIIFDAIDEAPVSAVDDIFERVLQWAAPVVRQRNVVVLSCRIAEVPAWVHPRVAEARLLPVADSEIDRVFEEIRQQEGRSSLESSPLHGLYDQLRDLCRNPLLLMMTAYLYQREGLEGLHDLRSKANLYRYFFDQLNSWERKKRAQTSEERALTSAAREAILGEIGRHLHFAGRVYVREADLLRWVGDAIQLDRIRALLSPNIPRDSLNIKEHLVSAPPMNARPRGALNELEYGFLHQTFGDVFAAIALQADDNSLGEAERLVLERSTAHWDVLIGLCGVMDGPERLTQRIVRIAFEERRQDLLLLAARCMRDRWDFASTEADDLCMRILEAFKYWDAFDYRLIHALSHLRLSPQLPRRIARDVQRFVTKYASSIPDEIANATTEQLFRYLDGGSPRDAINAAYTLGQRRYDDEEGRSVVVQRVMRRAANCDAALHEQLAATLKDLASPEARVFLEAICADRSLPPRSRAFALNGLGRIGDVRSVETVVAFMIDHSNQYRDSASWSLQMLAKVARATSASLFAEIKRVYVDALARETADIEGVSAKGNIMYSLGVLGASECLDGIRQALARETDAYVVEDGVNAVGLLAGPTEIAILAEYLNHEDPIVRMKAAEALLTVDGSRARPLVAPLLMDKYPIVRDAVRARVTDAVPEVTNEANGRGRIRAALSKPTLERDQVQVVLTSADDATMVSEVAETLLSQRRIQSRPRTHQRGNSIYFVFSEEAFTEIRKRFMEGAA